MGISGIGGVHPSGNIKSVSRVNSVGQSETSDAAATVTRANGRKRDTFQSDFSSLVKAVRVGDISAAQSALSALESDVTSTSATYSPASTSPAPVASPSQNDLDALFQAVRGGDVAGAQTALKQLELDVRSTGPHGNHASLQGQIHGRGHGRGYGHQGSNLLAAVAAAFQSQTSTPEPTTTPVADPVADPALATEVQVPVNPEIGNTSPRT
jgi:hypothetical protein